MFRDLGVGLEAGIAFGFCRGLLGCAYGDSTRRKRHRRYMDGIGTSCDVDATSVLLLTLFGPSVDHHFLVLSDPFTGLIRAL